MAVKSIHIVAILSRCKIYSAPLLVFKQYLIILFLEFTRNFKVRLWTFFIKQISPIEDYIALQHRSKLMETHKTSTTKILEQNTNAGGMQWHHLWRKWGTKFWVWTLLAFMVFSSFFNLSINLSCQTFKGRVNNKSLYCPIQ